MQSAAAPSPTSRACRAAVLSTSCWERACWLRLPRSFIPFSATWFPPKLPDLGADAVLAARVSELKPNTAKTFRFGTRPGLLVETASGEYRAMSATCTHLGCTVQYRPDLREIWCPCHNGMYDLNGRNISGPPPRPLEAFEVQVRGDDIFVRRKQEA